MVSAEFESALAAVKGLQKDPGNDVKLKLYALYKQATEGNASHDRPGFMDVVGRAKHDTWGKLAGTSPEDAEAQYIAIVADLTAP